MTIKYHQFRVGFSYSTRSICDHDTIYTMTVIDRTAKTIKVTLNSRDGVRTLRPSISRDGYEQVKPHGTYSMCAVIGADDIDPTPVAQQPIRLADVGVTVHEQVMAVEDGTDANGSPVPAFMYGGFELTAVQMARLSASAAAHVHASEMLSHEEITLETRTLPEGVADFAAFKRRARGM